MAIAKTRRTARGRWIVILLVIAALATGWVLWGEGLRRTGGAGVAYGARVGCACRYIAGRSLSDCAKDKLAGMEFVRLSDDDDTRSVTASIPLIASETATYHQGPGCLLQPWSD